MLMSDLVTRSQRRADMEVNSSIQIPEWKALISEQYGQMYSMVVKAGMRYFESTATITANGAATYPLPSDHDESIGIDRQLDSSGRKVQLQEFMVQERNVWSGQTGDAVAYSIVAQTIVFFPRPITGTYTHVYVAQSPDISSLGDTSTVDVVTADGEAFLIWGVAVKALSKTESDTRVAMQERDEAGARFMEDVTLRALINPRRRIVQSSPGDYYGSDYMNGIDGNWWPR